MSNSRAISQVCSLVFAIAFLTMKSGDGFSVSPFITYHLCMMNELSKETLYLKCYNVLRRDERSNDDGLVIPAHNSYNWTFHPFIAADVAYYCSAKWGKDHSLDFFLAFIDRSDFVDDGCGGRHCIWKFADDGVYLYYIPMGRYRFVYPWRKNNK